MKRTALLGATVWLGLAAVSFLANSRLHAIELLFLVAPLIIVPLGLELASRAVRTEKVSPASFFAGLLQLPAALCAAASFFAKPGIRAGLLALPWLLFAAVMAALAVGDLLWGAYRSLPAVGVDVSRLYLLVGCAWFVASRLGLSPMGFQEPIVLLTAVHFHFAGFAAPLLALAAGQSKRPSNRASINPTSHAFKMIAAGVLSGPGLLAAGFIAGPRAKLAAALWVACSEVALAVYFLAKLRSVRPRLAQGLVALSAFSVLAGMVLAAAWAVGEFPLQPFVHLDEMARYHGTLNGVGFVLCGMAGWSAASGSHTLKGGRS